MNQLEVNLPDDLSVFFCNINCHTAFLFFRQDNILKAGLFTLLLSFGFKIDGILPDYIPRIGIDCLSQTDALKQLQGDFRCLCEVPGLRYCSGSQRHTGSPNRDFILVSTPSYITANFLTVLPIFCHLLPTLDDNLAGRSINDLNKYIFDCYHVSILLPKSSELYTIRSEQRQRNRIQGIFFWIAAKLPNNAR